MFDNVNWDFVQSIYKYNHSSELLNDLAKVKASRDFYDYIQHYGYLVNDLDYKLIKRELSY